MQNGVVMAAFGPKYVEMAHRAAESIVQHNPGLEVDLFTEASVDRGSFSQVHILSEVWIRAKVDAMLHSRFERTLYLDADVLVLTHLSEVFELLERFDIAATHDQNRNSVPARRMHHEAIANSFPQLNGGVIAFRRSESVAGFLRAWKHEIKSQDIGKDQPSLRELLWKSDIRLAILPPEYNLWDISLVDCMKPERHTAPRILHSNIFTVLPAPAAGADLLIHYFGKARAYKIGLLHAADETLALRMGRTAQLPTLRQRNTARKLYALARFARLRNRLYRALPWATASSRTLD